ncbi:hypothetical protein C0J50_10792, partial [Silurus asotus]
MERIDEEPEQVNEKDDVPEYQLVREDGGAGCGKSHVIKCIYVKATKILHQLPRFREQEILIIDEVSMVSKDLFVYVNWRFQQIKGSKKPFGGISVLAVGDFYQLPPLRKKKPLCVYEGGVPDNWKDFFQIVNLTEIMRQKEDLAFAQLLNRIRVKPKHEALTKDDRALLAPGKPVKGKKQDLPDVIQVAAGVRVIVIINLEVEDGLANGSFGTIATIVSETKAGVMAVKMIGLKLDNPSAGQKHSKRLDGEQDNLVYVERFEERISKGVVRRQFP